MCRSLPTSRFLCRSTVSATTNGTRLPTRSLLHAACTSSNAPKLSTTTRLYSNAPTLRLFTSFHLCSTDASRLSTYACRLWCTNATPTNATTHGTKLSTTTRLCSDAATARMYSTFKLCSTNAPRLCSHAP